MRIFALDHGGTLEMSFLVGHENEDDLILKQQEDLLTVMRGGKKILPLLEKLRENPDALLAFHSQNKLKQQLQLLQQIKSAAIEHSLPVPHFSFIPVCDPQYAAYSCENPHITYMDKKQNIFQQLPEGADIDEFSIIASWGTDDSEKKSSIRQALEKAAEHYRTLKPERGALDKANSYIFDDGPGIPEKAIDEGWKGILVSEPGPDAAGTSHSLLNAVRIASGELVVYEISEKQRRLDLLYRLRNLLQSKEQMDMPFLEWR